MQLSLPNFIIGLIGLGCGVFVIIKSYYLNHHVLFLASVERKWGPGMGTTAYRLIGLGMCLFSLFVILGYIDLYGTAFGQPKTGQTGVNQTQIVNPSQNRAGNRIAD